MSAATIRDVLGTLEIDYVGPFACVTDESLSWWTTRAILDQAISDLSPESWQDSAEPDDQPALARAYESLCDLTTALESHGSLPEIEVTAHGYRAILGLSDRYYDPNRLRVGIHHNGTWVGSGSWDRRNSRIENCAAILGSDAESDAIYDSLDEALADAMEEVVS